MDFQRALGNLPASAGYDPFAHHTVEDLCYICLHELDLVAEREYWLPVAERRRLLRFITRFGRDYQINGHSYADEARMIFNQAASVQPDDCYVNDFEN